MHNVRVRVLFRVLLRTIAQETLFSSTEKLLQRDGGRLAVYDVLLGNTCSQVYILIRLHSHKEQISPS